MSLSLALSVALLMASPASVQAQAAGAPPAVAAVNPLAREPLYADIVHRARALEVQAQGYRTAAASPAQLDQLQADLTALSALDMQGHVDLAKRGTDGDLKCILKGISQDLTKKLAELQAAPDAGARAQAMEDLYYLLRDNVEVITTPPTVHS